MDMVKWSVRRDTLDDKLRDFLEWMRAVKIATVHHVCVYLFVGDTLSCISATFPTLVMLKVETPFTRWPQVLHTPVFFYPKLRWRPGLRVSLCACVLLVHVTKGDKSGYTHVKCWFLFYRTGSRSTTTQIFSLQNRKIFLWNLKSVVFHLLFLILCSSFFPSWTSGIFTMR